MKARASRLPLWLLLLWSAVALLLVLGGAWMNDAMPEHWRAAAADSTLAQADCERLVRQRLARHEAGTAAAMQPTALVSVRQVDGDRWDVVGSVGAAGRAAGEPAAQGYRCRLAYRRNVAELVRLDLD